MKHGAITFAFLLVTGAAGGVAFVGCGSDDAAPATTTDTGVADTGAADTKPPTDTNPPADTGPITCAQPLDGTFKCEAPAVKAGATTCNDAAITEIAEGCFGETASSAKCSAAEKKYATCYKCMLTDWLYGDPPRFIDTGACIKKIDAADNCATVWKCNIDCLSSVCGECDDTPGSGKTASTSEQDDCWSNAQKKGGTTVPKGACYDIATKDYAACRSNPKFAPCFVQASSDIVRFFRGACRDNGDWKDADIDKTPMTDAGADSTPTDTGAADTGAADTGSTATDAADAG